MRLTDAGRQFADADIDERKRLFSASCSPMCRLAAHIRRVLEDRANHTRAQEPLPRRARRLHDRGSRRADAARGGRLGPLRGSLRLRRRDRRASAWRTRAERCPRSPGESWGGQSEACPRLEQPTGPTAWARRCAPLPTLRALESLSSPRAARRRAEFSVRTRRPIDATEVKFAGVIARSGISMAKSPSTANTRLVMSSEVRPTSRRLSSNPNSRSIERSRNRRCTTSAILGSGSKASGCMGDFTVGGTHKELAGIGDLMPPREPGAPERPEASGFEASGFEAVAQTGARFRSASD